MTTPVLSCQDARIDDRGLLVEQLTVETRGDRVGLLGDWSPLFRLLSGGAALVQGEIHLAGHPAPSAAASGAAGVALLDVNVPEDWTALEYLTASARLLGLPRRQASAEAAGTLDHLGIAGLSRQRLGRLVTAERRAVLIAHACLGSPDLLALEAPLSALDPASVTYLRAVLDRALHGRRALVSARSVLPPGPETAFISTMDELLVLDSGALVAQAPPSALLQPDRRYLVAATRNATELAAELERLGFRVEPASAPTPGTGAARFLVEAPESQGTDLLVAAALELDAPLIELSPLGWKL